MKVLRYLLLALAAVIPFGGFAAETASQAIARVAKTVNDAASLAVKLKITSAGETSDLSMTISRQRFALSSGVIKVWYDGTTQWTYAEKSRELNISEPTAEELLECNPFAILNHYATAYNVRSLKSEQKGITTLELTPKAKSGSSIRRTVVSINSSTHLPTKMIMTMSNGKVLNISITSITKGNALPASTFVYNKQKFPASEVVDLR